VPVVIVPKIFPFVPLDTSGHPELIDDQASIDAFTGWFSFDQSPYSLGENGSHGFVVTITPPSGAEEKDYYFTFLIETQNSNPLEITGSGAEARIGANILLAVSKDGNPAKKAKIIDFSAPTIIDSFSGITYKVNLGNTGASFYKPVGKITVEQILGSTVSLNLAPLNVLVGGTRSISCISDQIVIPCTLPGKFFIGVYRANLSFTVDGAGQSIEQGTYTFAFPFTITLGLIMIIIGYGVMRKMGSRK